MNTFQRIFQIKLRIKEAFAISKLVLGWLIAKCTQRDKDLWLFCERGTDARDNGFWMFQYTKEHHPEINAKFIISKKSEDRIKFQKWESDLVEYESLRHVQLLWKAQKLISTHVGGFLPLLIRDVRPFRRFFEKYSKAKIVWLKHGIIKDNMKENHAKIVKADLVVCGAQPEYDYMNEVYGFRAEVLQLLGLARFDGLHNYDYNRKQILLMPTWRSWLKNERFVDSEYFNAYKILLCNKRLHEILKQEKLNLIFYPHYEIQPFISEFLRLDLPPNIIIADKKNYDVQQLLKESALLITDYSSVFFDFAYMRKPILYYQFDENKFRSKHYANGYYDYHDGLGRWTNQIDELIIFIQEQIDHHFEMEEIYRKKATDFFPIYDNQNCNRIFDSIKRL